MLEHLDVTLSVVDIAICLIDMALMVVLLRRRPKARKPRYPFLRYYRGRRR